MAQEHDEEEDAGLPSLDARFEEYCDRVESSADWGGQLELRALAQALERSITVYSVGMPPVIMGADARQGLLENSCTAVHTLQLNAPCSMSGARTVREGVATAWWLPRRGQRCGRPHAAVLPEACVWAGRALQQRGACCA